MSNPVFLHVMSDGTLYASNDIQYTPAGTITGTYRFLSDLGSQKIGKLSGTAGTNLTQTGATGKYPATKEYS